MRLTRPALTTAAMFLALTGLTSMSATAHATTSDGNDTEKCTISNRGDLDNLSCGPMIVGNSNVTGSNQSGGLGQTQMSCFDITNATGGTLTKVSDTFSTPGFPATIGVDQTTPTAVCGVPGSAAVTYQGATFSYTLQVASNGAGTVSGGGGFVAPGGHAFFGG